MFKNGLLDAIPFSIASEFLL
jgi:hypothetical protein